MKLSPSVFRSLIFLFFSLSVVTMQAQGPKRVIPDSIRISLLTCASGEEIYSLFGHTAIRYENYTRGIDAVFNYGIFNFNAPNFILRFALGETDYQLGVTDYERFAAEYYYLERDVWQQELNLTVQEKGKLVMLLEENYRPENRIYRYNFFYDNCATRPRDLIEKSIDGTLQYAGDMTDTDSGISFRGTSLVAFRHGLMYGQPSRQNHQPQTDDVCTFLCTRVLQPSPHCKQRRRNTPFGTE